MGCGLPLHPCWLDILYERANGYSYDAVKIFCSRDGEIIEAPYAEHVPPDVNACIFWLKNRRPARLARRAERRARARRVHHLRSSDDRGGVDQGTRDERHTKIGAGQVITVTDRQFLVLLAV